MEPLAVDDVLVERCLAAAGVDQTYQREPLRCWSLSGTERVTLANGASLFLKYARKPFDTEDDVLAYVARHGVPVPTLEASVHDDGVLVMALEDLGAATRPAEIPDAATAAVATHQTPPPASGLARLDADALVNLPTSCLYRLAELHDAGRWPNPEADIDALIALAKAAEGRAQGSDLEPFGLCHSEFHPSSVHINEAGWYLLDWARAFVGPGLLDLASWQHTTEAPDLDALDNLLDAYVGAGGPESAHDKRGGLPPAQWAFGWHRLWIIDWYLAQATTWIADPSDDVIYQQVIRRHLAEAVECLAPA
jgi:hypothetical protein